MDTTPAARDLIDRIARDGPMRLDRFLERCLYDSDYGYYATADPRADYTTLPQRSPLFRQLVARHLVEAAERLAMRHPAFVDLGAGDGEVVAALLDELARSGRHGKVYAVERSPRRRARAARRARGALLASSLDELPPLDEVVYFANECFDAFPPRLFRLDGDDVEEAFVASAPGSPPFHLVFLPTRAAERPAEERASDLAWLIGEARRVAREGAWRRPLLLEFQESLGSFLHALPAASVAYLLAVDYGYELGQLLDYPEGTLVAYRGHRVVSDILAACGACDVTCHVNWSLVARWLERDGWRARRPARQSAWLVELAAKALADEALCAADRAQALKRFVLPGTISDSFLVLEAWKGWSPS